MVNKSFLVEPKQTKLTFFDYFLSLNWRSSTALCFLCIKRSQHTCGRWSWKHSVKKKGDYDVQTLSSISRTQTYIYMQELLTCLAFLNLPQCWELYLSKSSLSPRTSIKSQRRGLQVLSSVSVPVDSSLINRIRTKIKTCSVQNFRISSPAGVFLPRAVRQTAVSCLSNSCSLTHMSPDAWIPQRKFKKKRKGKKVRFCQNLQKWK